MPLKRKASQIKVVHQHCEIHWAGKDEAAPNLPGIRALIKGQAKLQALAPSASLLDSASWTCLVLFVGLPSLPPSSPPFFSYSLSLSSCLLSSISSLPLLLPSFSFMKVNKALLHSQCHITDSTAKCFPPSGLDICWDICIPTWSFLEPSHPFLYLCDMPALTNWPPHSTNLWL
jgi:hypothetical protein